MSLWGSRSLFMNLVSAILAKSITAWSAEWRDLSPTADRLNGHKLDMNLDPERLGLAGLAWLAPNARSNGS